MIDKKALSERDICTKFINPAIEKAWWNIQNQVREEVSFKEKFTDWKIIVKWKKIVRLNEKRADYILYYKNNFPIAIIEAKSNKYSIWTWMQQGLNYAKTLDIPFVF